MQLYISKITTTVTEFTALIATLYEKCVSTAPNTFRKHIELEFLTASQIKTNT